MFWDEYLQDERGIRALVYTVLTDQKNRLLDKRLHDQFVNFMGYMCQEVVTLDSIENPTRKRMVENVLVSLVDQWKLNGRIDPNALFQPLPFLDVDVVVMMERTVYDQLWREEDKKLIIGLNVAAFELDLGEPLYANRFVSEVPWSGEDTSYLKAERKVLLKVTDAIGETFQQAAYLINEAHRRNKGERDKAQAIAEQQRQQQIRALQKEWDQIIRDANRILRDAPPDAPIVPQLQQKVEQLESQAKMPVNTLTDEQIKQNNQLAYTIQTHTNQLQDILAPTPQLPLTSNAATPTPTVESPPRFPTGFEPFESHEMKPDVAQNLKPIPSMSTSGKIHEREWLLPENQGRIRRPPFGQGNGLGNESIPESDVQNSIQSATSTIHSASSP